MVVAEGDVEQDGTAAAGIVHPAAARAGRILVESNVGQGRGVIEATHPAPHAVDGRVFIEQNVCQACVGACPGAQAAAVGCGRVFDEFNLVQNCAVVLNVHPPAPLNCFVFAESTADQGEHTGFAVYAAANAGCIQVEGS